MSYNSDDFAKIFETVFGYAPFSEMLKSFDPVQDTKDVFATATRTSNLEAQVEPVSEHEKYYRNQQDEQRAYERGLRDYEDEVRLEQENYEHAQYEIEREFDQRTVAVELAIQALGENSVHTGQPLVLAKEILTFLQEGNPL